MTSFTFDATIPAAANNPSNDQPGMLTNNISTNNLLAVDHVSFNSTGSGGVGSSGGQHLQVTFNSKNTPGAQTDPISTAFTANTATIATITGSSTTNAQLMFKNQNGTYLASPIKAFGEFTGQAAAGPVGTFVGSNITSITSSVGGTVYTIALTANAVSGTDVVVVATPNNKNRGIGWSFAANTLTLNVDAAGVTDKISFVILQV